MAAAKIKEMTVDEFLVWNLSQDERYELVDGFPVPLRSMAGATHSHDQIVVNLIIALGNQLRGTGCRPTTPDTAVRTSIKRVRRPDVTIECAPPEPKALEARNPVAAFEVLSPTTRKHDRTVKLAEYMRHPALRTIVHIDPDVMDVVIYRREADGKWLPEALDQPEHVVDCAGTVARLTLAQIYEDVLLAPKT